MATSCQPRPCDVCGATVSPQDILAQNIERPISCRAFHCKTIISQRGSMPPRQFSFHLEFHRDLHIKRKKAATKEKHRIAAIQNRELGENQRILDSVLKSNPRLESTQIELVPIPSGLRDTSPIPAERIAKYKKHLQLVIGIATGSIPAHRTPIQDETRASDRRHRVEQKFSHKPDLHLISDHLCSLCKGGCCTSGGNEAYLAPATIERFTKLHPGMTAEEVLDIYLEKIHTRSIANSCINQTESGCGLPRDMRSDVCNGFYCAPIESYHNNNVDKTLVRQALAVRRTNSVLCRYDPEQKNRLAEVALVNVEGLEKISRNVWSE